MAQAADRLFLDLADPLAGKTELLADLLEGHFLAADAEEVLDRQILEGNKPEFAITILDVNDLKQVNDTLGHQAGDKYLCEASKIICNIFAHSPVFRIGGDEFAVISQGSDYENIDELVN